MRKISLSILLIVAFSACGVSGTTKPTCESDAGNECDCDEEDVYSLAPETQQTVICSESTHLEDDECVANQVEIPDQVCGDKNFCFCSPTMEVSATVYRGCCGNDFIERSATELSQYYPGTGLIKGSSSFVYYLASDGKRYSFETISALESWFAPLDEQGVPITDEEICKKVVETTNVDLSSRELVGNVLFRPGAFIIGTFESPELYVVDRCSVYRQADLEILGKIYPYTVSQRIRLMPEYLFDVYSAVFGEPLTIDEEFNWYELYISASFDSTLGITSCP